MPNRPATFKQSDIARAVKGVQAGGCNVRGVEITPEGKIRVLTGDGEPTDKGNEWDEVL